MRKRNWKRLQASNLRQAYDYSFEYAKEQHNLSVEGIADLMGVKQWTLYKWVESGGMPIRLIRSFEHACGIDFVSRWMVMSNNKLVIAMPKGRAVEAEDLISLQTTLTTAIAALLKFYAEKTNLVDTLSALQTAMERLAWHRGNVEKFSQPEIPFDED